jgi:hypothetical protein
VRGSKERIAGSCLPIVSEVHNLSQEITQAARTLSVGWVYIVDDAIGNIESVLYTVLETLVALPYTDHRAI